MVKHIREIKPGECIRWAGQIVMIEAKELDSAGGYWLRLSNGRRTLYQREAELFVEPINDLLEEWLED